MKSNKERNKAKAGNGNPAWAVLTTADKNLAIKFYQSLFGWSSPDESVQDGSENILLLKEKPVAGMNQDPEVFSSKWRIHIDVADLDEVIAKILKAGGKIIQTFSGVEKNNRSARVADPSGAEFVIQQGRKQDSLTSEPGTFIWSEIITDDVRRSHSFYNEVFGWALSEPIAGDKLGRREWLLNGFPIAGILPRPLAMPKEIPPYWDVFFAVDVPSETVKHAISLGAVNLMPPVDIPHGQIAVFADPNGAVFSVLKNKV
jgi:predicted enzyme related to lactoylglutathione lyase